MLTSLKLLTLLIFAAFSNAICLQEEKFDFESKNELEILDWKKHKVIYTSGKFEKTAFIDTLCTLSNRRVAAALNFPNFKIKVYNIDSGEHITNLSNASYIFYMCEIPGNRFVSANVNKAHNGICIKIWNLNTYKLLKKFKIPFPPEKDPFFMVDYNFYNISIVYLKNDKLLVIFPKILIYTINLKSEKTQIGHSSTDIDKLRNIRQLDNNFIAIDESDNSITIFDQNFNPIDSIPINSSYGKCEILNHYEFILVDLYKHVFLYTNQKLKDINKILENHAPINDLKNIVLDYLGSNWHIEEIRDKENKKFTTNFYILLNNKTINWCDCGEHIELWTLKPLRQEKTKTLKTNNRHLAVFPDGTFVVSNYYDMTIYNPIFS